MALNYSNFYSQMPGISSNVCKFFSTRSISRVWLSRASSIIFFTFDMFFWTGRHCTWLIINSYRNDDRLEKLFTSLLFSFFSITVILLCLGYPTYIFMLLTTDTNDIFWRFWYFNSNSSLTENVFPLDDDLAWKNEKWVSR